MRGIFVPRICDGSDCASRFATSLVILTSSVLFGLAHLYQGRAGFVSTMVLGLLFGISRAALGSLIPVIVWHAGVDVVAGIAGPRYLLV